MICTDAGFLKTVEVGQYFMTKHTDEFSQFTESVACREYTLPRDEKSSDPKGWIRGNTKIGPVLEVTTTYLQGKFGVEIRIESVNKDHSHSWVRISHGLNKLVTDLSNNKEDDNNEQETLWDAVRRFCVENECSCFCEPIKGQSKTTKTHSCLLIYTNCTYQWKILDWYWARKLFVYRLPSVKKLSSLLRHGQLLREEDGPIEFWRLKDYLRNDFVHSQHWSDDMWQSKMTGDGDNKKRFQYCTDPSGEEILHLRALQDHPGRNPIDPTLHDNVLIPHNFLESIYHIGCAISLHSITNSGSIPEDKIQAGKDRRYSLRLWILWTKNTGIRTKLTWKHRVLHGTIRKSGRNIKTRFGRHKTCSKERIQVLSNTIERNHPLRHTPSLLYPEGYHVGNWRNHIRVSICVTSTTTDDFLRR